MQEKPLPAVHREERLSGRMEITNIAARGGDGKVKQQIVWPSSLFLFQTPDTIKLMFVNTVQYLVHVKVPKRYGNKYVQLISVRMQINKRK